MRPGHEYEHDIDDEENVSWISNIVYADHKFFLMANKRHGMLGQYLMAIDSDHPRDEAIYYIQWKTKLDIDDCDMQAIMDKQSGKCKGIVVSFKNIGINTYNVFVYDIKTKLIRFNFELFQLWESKVKGFLLSTNEFMILNKDGTQLISLRDSKGRPVVDNEGFDRFIHTLGSCNFLKIESTNHLQFSF